MEKSENNEKKGESINLMLKGKCMGKSEMRNGKIKQQFNEW